MGEHIYQNFTRPHSAIKGQTPVETAGLELELGKNKWRDLTEKAATCKTPKVRGRLGAWF